MTASLKYGSNVFDVQSAATFQPATGDFRGTIGMMVSALFGEILLIDQREVTR